MSKIISILGGSNAIVHNAYPTLLNIDNHIINNYAIGGTTSIVSLIQNEFYKICENSDVILFEYYLNDIQRFRSSNNSVDKIENSLKAFLNKVAKYNKKIIFILITHLNYTKFNQILDTYNKIIQLYDITYIDVWKLLINKDKRKYYMDKGHLNKKGMEILAKKIEYLIQNNKINNIHKNYSSLYDSCKYLHFVENTIRFKNSLIDIQYLPIHDKYKIDFDKNVDILAIDYLCDVNHGFIEFISNDQIIRKNTMQYKSIVVLRKKPMRSILTFYNKFKKHVNKLLIKHIKNKDIKTYDKNNKKHKHILTDDKSHVFNLIGILYV